MEADYTDSMSQFFDTWQVEKFKVPCGYCLESADKDYTSSLRKP